MHWLCCTPVWSLLCCSCTETDGRVYIAHSRTNEHEQLACTTYWIMQSRRADSF